LFAARAAVVDRTTNFQIQVVGTAQRKKSK
jgi:hypothetical protein